MNHNEDVAFNSIKLASDEESFSKNSGALLVKGGIGCSKTISTSNLISDCLLNKKSAIFQKNVVICGKLNVNIIEPNNTDVDRYIGTEQNRYTTVYANDVDTNNLYANNTVSSTNLKSNYLDIEKNTKIGKNINGNTMFDVDTENNTITMNSENFTINNNGEKAIDIDNKSIFLNKILKLRYQIINICSNYELHPNSTIILINNENQNDISIKLCQHISSVSNEHLDDGSYIKIYNISKCSNILVDNIYIVAKASADFLLHDDRWIPLGYEFTDRNDRNGNVDDFINNYEDCDSSSHFEAESSENIELINKKNKNSEECEIPSINNSCDFNPGNKFSLNDSTSFDL